MPDADGFPTPDELIRGPSKPPECAIERVGEGPPLTADQRKAISMIMSGLGFVAIAVSPTGETGADFFVAVDGDREALRNAREHLQGVIDRAFAKRGIV
jgi:hypothetical protein